MKKREDVTLVSEANDHLLSDSIELDDQRGRSRQRADELPLRWRLGMGKGDTWYKGLSEGDRNAVT